MTGDGADSGYFAARMMLQGGPLIMVAQQAAERFGIVLSQKFVAQAVPIAGSVGGALLNAAFLAHFRSVAEAHFTVRRLETHYGQSRVRLSAIR